MEFDELPAEEKLGALQSMAVFCRVEPSHKQRLVEMLKAQVSHPHYTLEGRGWGSGQGSRL